MRRKRNLLSGLKPPAVTLPKPEGTLASVALPDPHRQCISCGGVRRHVRILDTSDRMNLHCATCNTRFGPDPVRITITSIPCRYTVGGVGPHGSVVRDCSNPGCIERNACVRVRSEAGGRRDGPSRNVIPQCRMCMDGGIVATSPGVADYCPAVGCDARNHVRIDTVAGRQTLVRAHNINAPTTLGGAMAQARLSVERLSEALMPSRGPAPVVTTWPCPLCEHNVPQRRISSEEGEADCYECSHCRGHYEEDEIWDDYS